jgi:hypothetical protein
MVYAEITISDPWEVASLVTSPMRGTVVHLTGDSIVMTLDNPVPINGVVIHLAYATPRHVGVHFERSGLALPSNILLGASEPPSTDNPATPALSVPVAAIGTVSLLASAPR